KTFVHMLDGEITYTSALNVGTTFKVTLPHPDQSIQESRDPAETTESHTVVIQELMPEMEEEAELELEEAEVSPNKVTNITQSTSLLIVDDDKEIRDYLHDLFKDEYLLHTAKEGNEALAIIKQHQPEIVISDVMMEGMNGIELCAKIKSNPTYGHIQVILLTSSPSDAHKLEGVEEGADDYLNKPFDAELLKARVHTLIKNRKN